MREQHSEWELLDTAARETIVSGLQEGPMMREARENNVSGLQMSMMRGVRETNCQEESDASRRRAEPQPKVDVGVQSTAQSRAAHGENPIALLERQRTRTDA